MIFEDYKPSKELVKIIMDKTKEKFIEFYNQAIKENNPLIDKIKNVNEFLPTREDLQNKIGEDIHLSMVYVWKRKSIGEKIQIIEEEQFSQEFLMELKKRIKDYGDFPGKFYEELSKEVLTYYSKNKLKDKRFKIIASKKDISVLVLTKRKIPNLKEIVLLVPFYN